MKKRIALKCIDVYMTVYAASTEFAQYRSWYWYLTPTKFGTMNLAAFQDRPVSPVRRCRGDPDLHPTNIVAYKVVVRVHVAQRLCGSHGRLLERSGGEPFIPVLPHSQAMTAVSIL